MRRHFISAVIGLTLSFAATWPAQAQWVNPPGEGWLEVSVLHHDTDEEYKSTGAVEPFFADGHMIATSLYVKGALGLVRGMDVWFEAPVHHFRFDDAAGDRTKTGVGDLRGWLRIGPETFGLDPFLPVKTALRAGVKVPGSEFPVDAEIIPLTEGQRDWELLIELGRSLHPLPLYVKGWIGRRWREWNAELLWDPGDETFAFVAAGGSTGVLSWELAAEGMWGKPPVREGILLENERRKMVQLLPKVGVEMGLKSTQFQVGGQIPLDGRNLPAGPSVGAAVFSPVRLF